MRNTVRYPITLNEMIDAVERASAEAAAAMQKRGAVGDIHAIALHEAAIRLKRLQFAASEHE